MNLGFNVWDIPIQRQYLNLSIIELSKKADTLLSKAGQLVEVDIELNEKKECFPNVFFNDLIEAEITQKFLYKDLFLDKELALNSYFDWKDVRMTI